MIATQTHVKMEESVKMESRLSPVHVRLALLEHDVKQVSHQSIMKWNPGPL